MKLVVEFDIDSDIIECPDYIINDILEYRWKLIIVTKGLGRKSVNK